MDTKIWQKKRRPLSRSSLNYLLMDIDMVYLNQINKMNLQLCGVKKQ